MQSITTVIVIGIDRLASVRGNGVLETLHILDMHQGLSAGGASPAAQKPAEQPKRLPSVVDRAPFKAKKPAPPQAAAPPDPRNGEPGIACFLVAAMPAPQHRAGSNGPHQQ